MTATHRMTCCVCGENAGRWAQHWNRDTGYGICASCAAEQAGRESPANMQSLYGLPGVNFEQPTVQHIGRTFKLMATFRDDERGTKLANAYMERTEGASVLKVEQGRVFIVDHEDMGQPT